LVRNNVATEPEIFCNSSIASLNIASINKALWWWFFSLVLLCG